MKPPSTLRFPRNFAWGVATAAPQIEGSAFADGKGESIWDRFARVPGKISNGDTLDVACDHYRRYREDIALMRRLGVRHYRLSLAWPRLFPHGDGELNPKGLDFYQRLVDALLAAGITPWVTLFHWDLPQALEDRGGWRVRATPDTFARYADTAVRALGDRVKNWITLNEILCFTKLSYGGGDKAPGTNEGAKVVNQTYHHALLAHGHAVRAVREHGGRGARVGLTDNSGIPIPVTETERDIAAARRWFIEDNERVLEPIFTGRYSAAYLRRSGADRPQVGRGDLEHISQPTDFLGLNVYSGVFVRAGRGGRPEMLPFPERYPAADSAWLRLAPQALYWGPRLAAEIYGVRSIYITENGAGYDDAPPDARGEVLDLHRRDYLRTYLGELHRAIGDGVPVRGYFLWSFLDNFEWQDGYQRRFGIVHNDFKTQRRTPKLSAQWYSAVMRENRLV
ncbi:MAG TPA: GH1 family beta-glucosidase [Opitutaceae bacterium]